MLEVAAGDLSCTDPADEDERRLLIEAEHPEFADALDAADPEVLVGGQVVNAALHVSLHPVVATQLWNNDPPDLWLAAVRLTSLGYPAHDVLHTLISVVGEDVRRALAGEPPRDEAARSSQLAELPGSSERLGASPPANRADRRAARRRR